MRMCTNVRIGTPVQEDPVRLSDRTRLVRWPELGIALVPVGLALVAGLNGTPPAQAQTYSVLHTFAGADGANPSAGLIGDPAGNLYGTTYYGGGGNCGNQIGNGGVIILPCGVVFKLDPAGNVTVLHAFSESDGGNPNGGLLRDSAGNLYGTTVNGGAGRGCSYGCGAVFKLDTAGNETLLHSFTGTPNDGGGAFPNSGLIWDPALGLCGTASVGGAYQDVLVFTLDPAANGFSVLYTFMGSDGKLDWRQPNAGLIQDPAGNLYGTTYEGGSTACSLGCGVVFELDSAGNETVLHSFSGPDGEHPRGSLLLYSASSIYGTTSDGGTGYGVVFMLDQTGTETVL